MADDTMSGREVDRLNDRMRDMERRQSDFERSVDVRVGIHEQKCASRYMTILLMVAGSIAIQIPSAWPHLITLLGLAK